MARPRYEEMRSTIALALTPEGRCVWDAADARHRDAWIDWVRGSWRAGERDRRLDIVIRRAAIGNLDFASPMHLPSTDYGGGVF